MFHDPAFWVFVGFVLFVGLVLYMKVPGKIAGLLDERSAKIARDLDDAKRLREDAVKLLAEYQAKQQNALKEAEAIVAQAEDEAKRLMAGAETELKASIARRQAMAEAKIAQAEAEALRQVRVAAVDLAVAAAEQVLRGELSGPRATQVVDQAIADVGGRLN